MATPGGYENASGSMATLGGAAAAVPEPGTIALLAAGVLMLAVAPWRRRG